MNTHKMVGALCLMALVLACSGKESKKPVANADGEAIFKKYCVLCHGVDGKLGLNGAKDLTVSQLKIEERIVQVTKGKNTMTPFEGILSPEEIEAVASYTITLKK